MKFLHPVVQFVLHLGFFAPFVMGILDSSFLVLPFGNDLLVVGLVANKPDDMAWYIISAAAGSTVGAVLLALVARKIGEHGIRRIAGKEKYEKLKKKIGNRGGRAIAFAALAPPPFPYSPVIGAVAAVDYPIWRIALFNCLARGARFTVLSLLALFFGKQVMNIAHSAAFQWAMIAFIVGCIVASVFSVWRWLRKPRQKETHAS